ncbi:sodium- and chloride-dependent glycine transporter 1-like, partial [Octopus sinensis]|uniref:Sodium- and chloride-dependent glycine transporter 1-like n=1 Tax=Octopus sinensis TaxID=2607531 RepID=A0A6P7TXQ3_9MOLL
MLTVLLVRGVTLEGSLNGIIFFLKPDFKHLLKTKVWSDAATQIFFSLSTGTGGLITLSSFNKFKNNCLRDSILLTLINGATSIFVGCIVFSILGCISHEKGVPISSVSGKAKRICTIISDTYNRERRLLELRSILIKRHYPISLIADGIERAKEMDIRTLREAKRNTKAMISVFRKP